MDEPKLPSSIAAIRGNTGHIVNLQRALPENVILFVGAGLSVPFGLPDWITLLKKIARTGTTGLWGKINADQEPDLSVVASRIVADIGQPIFNGLLESILQEVRFDPYPEGTAVELLPQLTYAPVITTNLDHVLEVTYERAGRKFTNTVWGEKAREVQNPGWHTRLLIKLHGDCEYRDSYTITAEQYDAVYGAPGQPLDLNIETTPFPAAALLANILARRTSRSLFFLGCSLRQDRTLDVLHDLVSLNDGAPSHWALLERPHSNQEVHDRVQFLSHYNIVPIWFPLRRYDAVIDFLHYLHLHREWRRLKNLQRYT